ncbi:hypothetical protein RirG_087140 [Rhizophagus irregularis DAOM 197198w]|uniref:ATP-dependent DNA helicase n=1 Tax=Rhizophagus irregularis (strain DAOM 197198w) TaxID=1432141 RepID=A0A015LD57_RHIIW|nr:hypothetical protein RirG_087140 [Rhizophagus irregularis DAOM 197198w]
MVVAPTGVAAFNIEGSTIHSSLSVPICGDAVSCFTTAASISRSLQYSFGCQSIILVGDFGQLPPICGVLMYSQDSRKSDHLSEVVVPIAMQRQTGYSDKQQQFRNLSYHLRDESLHDPTGNY